MSRPKKARLTNLRPQLAILDVRTARQSEKVALPFYQSPEWKALLSKVFANRGRACQKCGTKEGRIYGDHIVELGDGGAALDEKNVMLLCSSCHTAKTFVERARRTAKKF